MSLIESIIMGIIQGITEFLPVSSSGHLALGKQILGLNDIPTLFDIMLHVGTLVAVFIAYWVDIKELIIEGFSIIRDLFVNLYIAISPSSSKKETIKGEEVILDKEAKSKKQYRKIVSSRYRKFVVLVIISTIPTGIMGIVVDSLMETAGNLLIIPGIGLICTSIILFIADRTAPGNLIAETTSYKKATILGVAQGFATLPGVSRSGTTIATCLLCGFEKTFAVKYSFIMSIPAILGAAVLKIAKFDDTISSVLLINYLVGTVVSGIVGYICIKTMLKEVRDKKFYGFSIYCFIVGAIAIGCYIIG